MPQYQDPKTKKWKFRTYVEDIYGNRVQRERCGFKTKAEAKKAEEKFRTGDNNNLTNATFYDV